MRCEECHRLGRQCAVCSSAAPEALMTLKGAFSDYQAQAIHDAIVKCGDSVYWTRGPRLVGVIVDVWNDGLVSVLWDGTVLPQVVDPAGLTKITPMEVK